MARGRAGDRSVLWLEYQGERMTLLLVCDPQQEEQALAHGCGYALSYLDRNLSAVIRPILLKAAKAFNGRSKILSGPLQTVELLRSLLPPEVQLTLRGTAPAGLSLPRWPGFLRTGPSPRLEQSLWPFDPELAAMRAGLRRLAKRDWLTPQQRDKDAAWLKENGVLVSSTETADSEGRYALFAAASSDVLNRALAAEAALGASGSKRESAAEWLGEALGYPACCVDAFQRLGRRDDLTLAMELLPPIGSEPASPFSQWLNGPLALISHTPCSLYCNASIALAQALLVELEKDRPGFSAQWEQLARRIQVIDAEGRCLALEATGSLNEEVTVLDALIFHLPSAENMAGMMQPLPELEGSLLRNIAGELTGREFRAVFVADHR
jgi:hypothetical protein